MRIRLILFLIVLLLAALFFGGVAFAETPDEIRLTAHPSTILAGGYETTIIAQLYLGGSVLAQSGVPWTMMGWGSGYIELVGTIPSYSDANGQIQWVMRSLNGVNGNTDITMGILEPTSVYDTVSVYVSGWGIITGKVYDSNMSPIGGAIVTLWPGASSGCGCCCHDSTTSAIDAYVLENPQDSADGTTAPMGQYQFQHVPYGTYCVEAQMGGKSGCSIVSMGGGTMTADVVIPDFVNPTPSPTPSTIPPSTATPTTVPTPTTTTICPDSDGDGWSDCKESVQGTNPHLPDTDGDGLIDSEDPAPLNNTTTTTSSDVTKETTTDDNTTTTTTTSCPDTDGDGWDDCYEEMAGTNPHFSDTDGDGLIDSQDPNPLIPATTTENPGFELVLGLVVLITTAFVLRNRR